MSLHSSDCPDDLRGEQGGSGSHDGGTETRPTADGLIVGQRLGPPLTAGQIRSVAPLDEAGARSLTERIKHAVGNTCLLLLEAHSRRAWSALGYMTWEQYVREEFGLSRSRSYELLDHGRLIRTIEVAAGVSGIADISTFAARRLKPRMHEIAAEVRHRTANAPQDQVAGIVATVIGEERAKLAPSASVATDDASLNGQPRRSDHHRDLSSLYDAINMLAEMPSVEDTLARIPPDHRRRLAPVNAAAAWLAELAEGLKASLPAQWRDTPRT